MTSAQASRIVAVSMGLLVVFTLLERRSDPRSVDTYRRLWAIGAFGLGLAVLADFVPQVAGPFAVLVLIAAAVRHRGRLGVLFEAPRRSSSSSAGTLPAGTRGAGTAPPKRTIRGGD